MPYGAAQTGLCFHTEEETSVRVLLMCALSPSTTQLTCSFSVFKTQRFSNVLIAQKRLMIPTKIIF